MTFPKPPGFVAQRERVLVVGVFTGKIKATTRTFITVRDGKLTRIREYIDTQTLAKASAVEYGENRTDCRSLSAGIMFTVFGLNGFLNFIHQPPPPNPLALQFLNAISASHISAFFFAHQLVAGLLLLSGYFVPLALVLLAAEIFNILAFHLTMAPATVGSGTLAVLWVRVFLQHRPSFDGILSAKRFNQLETE